MYKQNEKLSQNGSIPTNIEKLALEKGLYQLTQRGSPLRFCQVSVLLCSRNGVLSY